MPILRQWSLSYTASIFAVFAIVALPASSFIGFKIGLLALALLTSAAVVISKKSVSPSLVKLVILYLACLSFLLFFLAIGWVFDFGNYAVHFRAFAGYCGFLTAALFFLAAIEAGSCPEQDLIRAVVWSCAIYNSLKLVIFMLPVVGLINVRDLMTALEVYVGSMTYNFFGEDAIAARISFGNDVITPFVTALLLAHSGISRLFSTRARISILAVTVIGSAVSFSRYFWLVQIFILFGGVGYVRRQYFTAVAILVSALISIYAMSLQFDWLQDLVSIRFGDVESLNVKNLQTAALFNGFLDHSVVGVGLGGFLGNLVRSEYQPYIYESQWMALLYQLGLLGAAAILVLLLSPLLLKTTKLHEASAPRARRSQWFFRALYLIWLLSGTTNPYLFIMSSSTVYILLYLALRSNAMDADTIFSQTHA